MKNKINFKSMVIGGIVGAVIMGAIPTAGYDGVRTIQAVYKNIRICVDGVEMTPRDSAGQVVEPFIYNGTTYLPVRAVGEAVGKEVTYDGSTSTVYLGKSGTTKYLGQQVEAYQTSGTEEGVFSMGGQDYVNSLRLYSEGGTAFYNLNGLYTSISGVYGMRDGTDIDAESIITFYGDGRQLQSIKVRGGELPKNFAINVSGVAQLEIEYTSANGWGSSILGNVEFR